MNFRGKVKAIVEQRKMHEDVVTFLLPLAKGVVSKSAEVATGALFKRLARRKSKPKSKIAEAKRKFSFIRGGGDDRIEDPVDWLEAVGKKVKARKQTDRSRRSARLKAKRVKKSKPDSIDRVEEIGAEIMKAKRKSRDANLKQLYQDKVNKSTGNINSGYEIPFREKVKDILEADLRPRRPGKRTQFQINRDHQRRDQHDKGRTEGGRTGQARLTGHYDASIERPQDAAASLRRAALQKMNLVTMYSPTGRKSQGLQVVRDSDDHKLALKHGFAESSNHPFYQKVKALSRGKKSQSILEKKSKTIKLLIGRIKPCGEKSKVDETYKSTRKWQPGDEPKQTGREPVTTPASDKAFKKRQKKFLAGIKKIRPQK